MESHRSLAVLMLLCLIKTCYGGVLFSSLPRTIAVHASPSQGQVLKAGEDRITVRWGLNQTLLAEGSNNASSYKNVKLKLCFSPVSQVDRPGRKTNNDLFQIQAVNGHDRSLEISSVCFSALSVLSLFGMFLAERNKGKRSPSK